MLKNLNEVHRRLDWMREQKIWPIGPRYLWTDAFGVVLMVSLYLEVQEDLYFDEAEWIVRDVNRVLGRDKGLSIGENHGREGQYYHYLAMWIFALTQMGKVEPRYKEMAIQLVREIHPYFVKPGVGVFWKMEEDLKAPSRGHGFGALDPYDGYVIYNLLDKDELSTEIRELHELIEQDYRELFITQDLGLGMMLWLTHFFPAENWAKTQRERSLLVLSDMWVDPPGYFCRFLESRQLKYAFTNYGITLGLQAVREESNRVEKVHEFFKRYRSGDTYDVDAITHVMACTSHFPGLFIKSD